MELLESGDRRELSAAIDLVAYRVIQESLTNVRKHAAGAGAKVALAYAPRELTIEIVNGPGSPSGYVSNGAGHGLIGMRERVTLFGGTLAAGSADEGGFRVHAVLPPLAPDGPCLTIRRFVLDVVGLDAFGLD